MTVPDAVREQLRDELWARADQLDWLRLSSIDKSRYYENWTRAPDIGEVLGRYMDLGQVRVYIKDTLLKAYARERMADASRPLRILGVSPDEVVANYIKPHGRLLSDGSVICWGKADDWKSILMAIHERAFTATGGKPYAAVLTQSAARYPTDAIRLIPEDAARKLGIERLVWLD